MISAWNEPFEVIIAGAGPAGCVLASRLSEIAGQHVPSSCCPY